MIYLVRVTSPPKLVSHLAKCSTYPPGIQLDYYYTCDYQLRAADYFVSEYTCFLVFNTINIDTIINVD